MLLQDIPMDDEHVEDGAQNTQQCTFNVKTSFIATAESICKRRFSISLQA